MRTNSISPIFAVGVAFFITACNSDSKDPAQRSGDRNPSSNVGNPSNSETGAEHDDSNVPDENEGTGGSTEPSTDSTNPDSPEPSQDEEENTDGRPFVPDMEDDEGHSCDPWSQDCPKGEKCVAYASSGGTWDSNKCVPVLGEGQPGDTCTYQGAVVSEDDCGQDSWCWDADENGVGFCVAFCTGTAEDAHCDGETSCTIANMGSINICLELCDPLEQDCYEGAACYFDSQNFICAPRTTDVAAGEPCGFINDCSPGSQCIAPALHNECAGDRGCCASFCEVGDDEACASAGTDCLPFYANGDAPPGQEKIGMCMLPTG